MHHIHIDFGPLYGLGTLYVKHPRLLALFIRRTLVLSVVSYTCEITVVNIRLRVAEELSLNQVRSRNVDQKSTQKTPSNILRIYT